MTHPLACFLGLLLLASVSFSGSGRSETSLPDIDAGTGTAEADSLARVEAYLNKLQTMRARFLQVGTDGAFAEGLFWLARPGHARFEYAPPVDLLLVADGTWLIFFDAELDQVTHIPIGSGPFRFLLGEEVRFDDEILVEEVERQRGIIRVRLRDADKPGEGSVTLQFEENPMRLRQWEVIDAQGTQTAVTLSEIETGLDLDRALFRFTANDQKNPEFRMGDHD